MSIIIMIFVPRFLLELHTRKCGFRYYMKHDTSIGNYRYWKHEDVLFIMRFWNKISIEITCEETWEIS